MKHLTKKARIQFGALAVERLSEIVYKFSGKYLVYMPTYAAALEFCFDASLNKAPKAQIERWLETVETMIPDTEDYSDVLADQAQCAFIAVYYCLCHILDAEEKSLNHCIQKVNEAMDIYGYECGSVDTTGSELSWQKELTIYFQSTEIATTLDLNAIRSINRQHMIPAV